MLAGHGVDAFTTEGLKGTARARALSQSDPVDVLQSSFLFKFPRPLSSRLYLGTTRGVMREICFSEQQARQRGLFLFFFFFFNTFPLFVFAAEGGVCSYLKLKHY